MDLQLGAGWAAFGRGDGEGGFWAVGEGGGLREELGVVAADGSEEGAEEGFDAFAEGWYDRCRLCGF